MKSCCHLSPEAPAFGGVCDLSTQGGSPPAKPCHSGKPEHPRSPQAELICCCRNSMPKYPWSHAEALPTWFGGFRGFLGLIEGCQDSPDHLCTSGFGSFYLRVHIKEVLGPIHCHIILVIC